MGEKLSFNFVKEYIESFGFKLINSEYINDATCLDIQCSIGHIFQKTYNKFKYNTKQCPKCLGKQKTFSEIKSYILSQNYELISMEYKNNRSKLDIKDMQGYYYSVTLSNLHKYEKTNSLPDKFSKYNPHTIQNIKLWCKLNNKPFELISNVYDGNNIKLQWKCLKEECGEIFETEWGSISGGTGCGACDGRQVGLSNCLATKRSDIAEEWHPTKNGNLTPYDVTCGSNKYAWWQCKKCNHEWEVQINGRCGGNTWCPECNESKGEKRTKGYLEENNIRYITQFTFLDCRNKNVLPFDFAIFINDKLYCLIEYDGILHYEDKFNNPVEFKNIKLRDSIKTNYCLINNIKLVRIPYWDFDNIETILEKELEILSNGF